MVEHDPVRGRTSCASPRPRPRAPARPRPAPRRSPAASVRATREVRPERAARPAASRGRASGGVQRRRRARASSAAPVARCPSHRAAVCARPTGTRRRPRAATSNGGVAGDAPRTAVGDRRHAIRDRRRARGSAASGGARRGATQRTSRPARRRRGPARRSSRQAASASRRERDRDEQPDGALRQAPCSRRVPLAVGGQDLERALAVAPADDLDRLVLERLYVSKKCSISTRRCGRTWSSALDVRLVRVADRDAQDLEVEALLVAHLEPADRPGPDVAAGERRLVDDQQGVGVVAVVGARALDEAVVEVVEDGRRQDAVEPEDAASPRRTRTCCATRAGSRRRSRRRRGTRPGLRMADSLGAGRLSRRRCGAASASEARITTPEGDAAIARRPHRQSL